MKPVYGPVASWRLGRSLGIDPICRLEKTCSFDCIYCQLGKTKKKTLKREIFLTVEEIINEFKSCWKKIENRVDVITFSGTGEPTLALNLGDIANELKDLSDKPLAILTNSSLLFKRDVRKDLMALDIVVAKLDAPNQEVLERVNKPVKALKFDKIMEGLRKFRENFDGKFAIQIMFIKENLNYLDDIIERVRELNPDEVQINTPLRPSPVEPLSREEISRITKKFSEFKRVLSVYNSKKLEVTPLDINEMKLRRKVEQ